MTECRNFHIQAIGIAGFDLFKSLQAAVVLISAFACLSFLWYDSEINGNGQLCHSSYQVSACLWTRLNIMLLQCTTLGFDAGLHGDFANLHADGDDDRIIVDHPLWIEDDTKQQSRWALTLLYILAWEWVTYNTITSNGQRLTRSCRCLQALYKDRYATQMVECELLTQCVF